MFSGSAIGTRSSDTGIFETSNHVNKLKIENDELFAEHKVRNK